MMAASKQHGGEHVAEGIGLRSEVPGAGRSGLAHSHDDHYRASFRRSGSAEPDDPLAGQFWRQVTHP